MFLVLLVSLISSVSNLKKWSVMPSCVALTAASKLVNKVNENFLSIINTCVNKVNAAFTNVNATATKFGGGVSLFFRCAAPTVLDYTLPVIGSSVIGLSKMARQR